MARLNEVLNYDSKYTTEGVLKNKLNITDEKALDDAERVITGYKLANLYLNSENQKFDINHYLSIHKYLFEDIYDFAGEIRSENIKKSIPFCLPNLIYENLKTTLARANIAYKNIKNEEDLVDFIAYFYSELDIIHPFREGNGRGEREFLRQYVERINKVIDFGEYHLDYNQREDKDSFTNSVIIADSRCEYDLLKENIRKILIKENKLRR